MRRPNFGRLKNGINRIIRWYGANPLHLLALLACFGLAGYAAAQLVPARPSGPFASPELGI